MLKKAFQIISQTILCCATYHLAAAGAPVKLQYIPNQPVIQTSTVSLKLNQTLPGFTIDTEATQNMTAQLTITSEAPEVVLQHPPVDLVFILKSLSVNIDANGESSTFTTATPEKSLLAAQLGKALNRPIRLHFGDNFTLRPEIPDMDALVGELPALGVLEPKEMMNGILQYVFAVAGKELSIGDRIERNTPGVVAGSGPSMVVYEITAITDQTVAAAFHADIPARTASLKTLMKMGDKPEEKLEMTLSGTMKGEGSWDRHNAMLYHANARYEFTGSLKIGDAEWQMAATVVVDSSTAGNH